jgi:hypothetical protein
MAINHLFLCYLAIPDFDIDRLAVDPHEPHHRRKSDDADDLDRHLRPVDCRVPNSFSNEWPDDWKQ